MKMEVRKGTALSLAKGYKQTEVGVIPEDWEVKELGNICFPSKSRINPITSTKNFKCVELEHLSQGTGTLLGYAQSKDLLSQKSVFEKGDVLFGKLRPYLKKYLFADFEGVCTTEIWVLKTIKGISNKFLYHLVQSGRIIEAANLSTGTKMPRAEWKIVSETAIALPTKSEQTAIATALSDADALITGLEKLIEKKRAIKQGAMQKCLNPDFYDLIDGSDFKPNQKNQPNQKYQSSDKWEVKKLGEIFSITAGGDLDTGNFSSFSDEKYCYPIYSNSLSDKGLYGYSSMFTSEKDTITVTARGTVGYANSRDHRYTAIGRVLILNPIQKLDCFFISELINTRLVFANESTGVPQLTAPQISKYEISIPAFGTQTRIATILSDMDAEITALEQKLAKYKQIKQGMMQELLTGRIRLEHS